MPHPVLVALLLGVLLAAVVSFAVVAVLRQRRTRSLSEEAYRLGLRFSRSDPFNAPLRFRAMALMRAGHSGRAHNVTYGHYRGLPMRTFDFRYEVGHGPRRLTRRFAVVVLESADPLPDALLWNHQHGEAAPFDVRLPDGQVGPWTYLGNADACHRLAAALAPLAERPAGLQAAENVLMVFEAIDHHAKDYSGRIEMALESFRRLGGRTVADTDEPAGQAAGAEA